MENLGNKITAIIKTSNSEATLYNTLESIKELDEIYIIDENSTDDTTEIAKQYKAKIIYSNKGELIPALNQATDEAIGDWIFVIKDNEIIPQKLIYEIKKYTESPKKNRNAINIPLKTIFCDKEIKSASNKKLLRIFKKGTCSYKGNYSISLKLEKGKIHSINPNFKIKNGYILSYIENDTVKNFTNILEKNRIDIKTNQKTNYSIFIKPVLKFLNYYILKRGFLDGRLGYILSVLKFFEEFTLQLMIMNKNSKGENNDIR